MSSFNEENERRLKAEEITADLASEAKSSIIYFFEIADLTMSLW